MRMESPICLEVLCISVLGLVRSVQGKGNEKEVTNGAREGGRADQ